MVTASREGTTKTGKPFSSLTLTDYTDSKEFMFFGQDYVNFSRYCKTGLFVLIRGNIQKGFRGDQLEFKITNIELLSEVRKNYVKSITLNMPVTGLTHDMVEKLEKMSLNNKGRILLRFNIYDPESNMNIQMFSRNIKIELTDEMIGFLRNELKMSFRIN
jgi:DNA polymerase-3 subunit alpha